jgi:protein phosphatase 4 regulatory subunit 3
MYLASQPLEMRRVDVDEESYFNGDDEEEDDEGVAPGPHPAQTPTIPLIPPPLTRFQTAARRKRQHSPSIPLRIGLGGATQRAPPPSTPIHLPRTPPISALVEYGDDDEQSSDPEDSLLESLVSSKPPPSGAGTVTVSNPLPTTTTTTTMTMTMAPSAAPTNTTATMATTGTGPGVGGGGFVPLRAEKRRRAEEEEDEMGLERLIGTKSKRPTKTGTTGAGEEAPKRIRLRFGAATLAAASSTLPTAARSESGAKDGDTG